MAAETERRLWAKLQLGSHLYGTTVEGSDQDFLELYLPTTVELASNERVHIPQTIENGVDTRRFLLGAFVMSLGTNPEHSVLAYHYSDKFWGIQHLWMNGESLRWILDVAESMWTHAKAPKQKAHAYRYVIAIRAMASDAPLYPMLSQFREIFMGLRNDEPSQLTTLQFNDSVSAVREYLDRTWKSSPGVDDKQRRAEWVLLRYLGLA